MNSTVDWPHGLSNATLIRPFHYIPFFQDGLSESLFVVEPSEEGGEDRLCGVLSHTDILAFILSCEQQQASM